MRKIITPLAIAAAILFASQNIFAQVGINTQQPDPSAALDIVGTDKGLLIPRVSLQSLTDNTTVPNPATALLIYNTNEGLGKAGFYYNSGTAADPQWTLLNTDAGVSLPFAKTGNGPGAAFFIENANSAPTSSGITGNSVNAIGVRGVSQTGRGIVGATVSTGTGVFASSANVNGKALEVSGPMKIAGIGQSPGNGKVLMSDGSGNATWENISGDVAFRASGILGDGSENVPPFDVVKIAFANENYDLGDQYNNANGSPHSTFIVPKKGIYHFDISVGWNCSSGKCSFETGLQLALTRNGIFSLLASDRVTGIGQGNCSISIDVQLNQGDLLSAQINSSNASQTLVMDSGYFSGRLLFAN